MLLQKKPKTLLTSLIKIFIIIGLLIIGIFVYGLGSILYDALIVSTIVDSSEKLSKCFLTTGNYIYYYSIHGESYTIKRLKTSPEKFQVLYSNSCLGKDDKHIFFADKILSEADLATFEPVPGQIGNNYPGYIYFRDKDSVFIGDRLIPEADIQTFQILPHMSGEIPHYTKDKNNFYYDGKVTTDLTK